MSSSTKLDESPFLKKVTSATLHVGLMLLLLAWCLKIVAPFVLPVIWAMVLAVALAPLHARLAGMLGGRNKLSASLISIAGLSVLLVPTVLLLGSLVDGATELAKRMSEGTLRIPPPSEKVAEWPLVGEKVSAAWLAASENTAEAAQEFAPQLATFAAGLMGQVASLGFGVLAFAFSTIVAGVFLCVGSKGTSTAESVLVRLLGERGREMLTIIVGTIRSVAQGVLGVAVIQALLVGVGLVLMGVPAAGLWALAVLILAIVQLPPLIVTAPIIFYVFSVESGMSATIFAVWTVVASGSDTFLKPLFLGRGLDVPMLFILVGAIGGMMAFGILGLFLGAVLLAIFHMLFVTWVSEGAEQAEAVPQADAG